MSDNQELSHLLERKTRQENMNDILNVLNPDKTEFNTMVLGFTDIIQSTFYNYLSQQCLTEKTKADMDERINRTVNEVMTVLNRESLSNPEDMVILSTIMIEAVSKALVRQQDGGLRVSQTLQHLRQSSAR